jgi:hypothetical protein
VSATYLHLARIDEKQKQIVGCLTTTVPCLANESKGLLNRSTPYTVTAVDEFLAAITDWCLIERYTNNNGLMVLRRVKN